MMWTCIKKKKKWDGVEIWGEPTEDLFRSCSMKCACNLSSAAWRSESVGPQYLKRHCFFNLQHLYFHSIQFFNGFVCGKNNITVFSVEILLHLFGCFSGSSPCFPHLPATAQPVVLVWNQGNKFMRGKNAAITKAACFHLHFPLRVVIIPPFLPSCGICVLAQARCCFVRHH